MNRTLRPSRIIVLLLAVALTPSCDEDDNLTDPGANPPVPGILPAVPVPSSAGEVLPIESEDVAVGLSGPIENFEPLVAEIQMMQDDGSAPWITMNRRLILACAGVLPEYSSDPAVAERAFIAERPRLLHRRNWRKLNQVTLAPGTSYEQEETIAYGTSTAHHESREFSRTIGVAVQVGGSWSAFSASVTASFGQTETVGEINSVTFREENTFSKTYAVPSDPQRTIVYALWQLVDKFSLVDADSVRIHESPALLRARITEIVDIEFPNRDMIYQSVTRFE